MSRAFVKEDAPEPPPPEFRLPPRNDPGYLAAAAAALLEGARTGHTAAAEVATGYAWGAPQLLQQVESLRERAEQTGDDRLEQVADRYLRRAEKDSAAGR